MDRASDLQLEIVGSNLGSGRNCQRGGVINEHSLYLQYHDWGETLSKALNPQLLPGQLQRWLPLLRVRVHSVCVHCCVCALGWVKFRAQIPSMGHHTWPHFITKNKK